jgi:glycine oxidase
MPAKGVPGLSTAPASTADVVVAGGGVIGTAIAWRAALAGLTVVLVDPDDGVAATQVAAGMLAPVSESMFGEEDLLRINLLAVRRFPEFAAELEEATGQRIGLRREGTLAVAYDPGDYAALMRLTAFRRQVGLTAQELDSRECRALEPFLTPDVHGGVLFPGDWSVNNRRYAAALKTALTKAGVTTIRDRVSSVRNGVALHSGDTIDCGTVVVAAGSRTGEIAGLPAPLRTAIRPVKGQLLRLAHPGHLPPVATHTIRATVRGTDIYLVPREDGELVVGATQEEQPDQRVTAGAVHDLLHDAMSVLPVTSELILAEACAGLRPGTPDNGPVVGPVPGNQKLDNSKKLLATGHYRNGILLSAATADAVVAYLTGTGPDSAWLPFTPGRFTSGRSEHDREAPIASSPFAHDREVHR